MKKKLLPIGVQTFKKMREGDYIYIDKTQFVYQIATEGSAYFFSRPRRFGKSLLISTFKELFSGQKDLFKGLWIEDKWDWSKTYPVIHFSFAALNYQGVGLKVAIEEELKRIAIEQGILLATNDLKDLFKELIEKLYRQQGSIVLLIDEYDKPIIDYLEKEVLDQAKANQTIMKNFYSVLKDAEEYLRMLFITGVSKFSQVSIFSDLNHLSDLTLTPQYATIAGYTQTELEHSFEDYIQELMQWHNIERAPLLALIREWYNGFSWDGINTVYNPFGTLNFFHQKDFRNYWFATGTPTFLINLMKKGSKFDFENTLTTGSLLNKYTLDNLDIVALLFQTGYLTIVKRDYLNGNITLDYPNREIRDSLYAFTIDSIAPSSDWATSGVTVQHLKKAFEDNDLSQVQDIINTLFADLPYDLYINPNAPNAQKERLGERFFHGLIHLLFKYLGIHIQSEVHTARGRADSVVYTPTHIYIFEFKYNKTAEVALEQLKNNGYALKFKASNKILIGVGANFSSEERQIDGWIEAAL